MSELKRTYDLLRGYVNHEWDRIRSIDLDKALEELDLPTSPKGESQTQTTQAPEVEATPPQDPKQLACTVLGVEMDASFEDIKKAFDRLNKRSNPANFPEGSEEYQNAAKIQARVNWAYRTLIDDKSDTEKRFKSLEID